jgi:hypothetical protein
LRRIGSRSAPANGNRHGSCGLGSRAPTSPHCGAGIESSSSSRSSSMAFFSLWAAPDRNIRRTASHCSHAIFR